MKRFFAFIVVLLFALIDVWAKAPAGNNVGDRFSITRFAAVRHAAELTVSFRVEVAADAVKRDNTLILTPVLSRYNHVVEIEEDQRMWHNRKVVSEVEREPLPSVVIQMRRGRIFDERDKISYPAATFFARNGAVMEYTVTIPYGMWMEGADFSIEGTLKDCCSEQMLCPLFLDSRLVVKNGDPVVGVENFALESRVEPETTLWESSHREMSIDFPQGKSSIDMALMNNRIVLDESVQLLEWIRNTSSLKLGRIRISGYASPEGKPEANFRLASMRAEAFKGYLKQRVPLLADSLFEMQSGGVNWQGLRRLVADSQMPAREEVLYTIDHTPQQDNACNRALMALHGGKTYRYMAREFFPKIRNACYITIHYYSLGDQKAEMINRAIVLINSDNWAPALALLRSSSDDPRSWNLLGVCYMISKQWEQAEKYLQKAEEAGNSLAGSNLALLQEIRKANYNDK